MKIFSNLKGDIMGGITTAVITLPWAIAFGIVAYAPLGEQYVAQGALAGLYGVIVAGTLASLFGSTTGLISLPTALQGVMTTSIITMILKDHEVAAIGSNQIMVVLVLTGLTICFAGILQLLLGLSGGGKLVKFIPYPVVAGFMNGIAVIIFMGQLRPLFGAAKDTPLLSLITGEAGFRYETLIVGGVTIAAMLITQRLTKAIPGSLIGLLCGVASYFIIGNFFNPSLLVIENNPLIIGPVPAAVPSPTQLLNFFSVFDQISLHMITILIVPALTLGILASVDSLLSSVVSDMVTRTKHNSVKELLAQGAGNISAAVFGGLPIAGSTLHALVNINAGGRTMLSGIVNSLALFLIVLFCGSLVQWIPMAVLAGILLITAFTMVEAESINMSLKKSAVGNLFVIIIVTVITVAVDLIIAVLIGLIITAFMFIREQINKDIVRKVYSGDQVYSKKIRSQTEMKILLEKGKAIKIYELNGSLFFGTCDKVMSEIEADFNSFIIILDFKRVHTIDLTGAQLLKQVVESINEKGNHLLISYLDNSAHEDKQRMLRLMKDVGVIAAIGKEHFFPDTDHAQEWAEERIIRREMEAAKIEREKLALKNLSVFQDLKDEQLELVRTHMQPHNYRKDEIVFREGDPGDKIYFLLSGEVSVLTSIAGNGRARRLATFGEGVFFGDMAILEKKPRSATVRADSDAEVLYMTVTDFEKLVHSHPLLASKMLLGMSRELSYRLRLTNTEIRALEE